MEAEVVVIFTPLTNISSTQGWERHWTRYLGPPAVTDGTAEEVVDTNPIISIDFRQEDDYHQLQGYRTNHGEDLQRHSLLASLL